MACETGIYTEYASTKTINELTLKFLYIVQNYDKTKYGAKLEFPDGSTKSIYEGESYTYNNKIVTTVDVSDTSPYATIKVCDSTNIAMYAIILLIALIALIILMRRL